MPDIEARFLLLPPERRGPLAAFAAFAAHAALTALTALAVASGGAVLSAELAGGAPAVPGAALAAGEHAEPRANPPSWQRVEPGGAPMCADGSPYHFFVRDGDPARLVVFFQGGGACWSGATCDPEGDPSYRPSLAGTGEPPAHGIFAAERADNPFAGDTVLFVPYCTGDVHLGDRVQRYRVPAGSRHPGRTLRIQHRGAVNAAAALDWLVARHAAPAQVFVAGSSAGAIAAPFFAARLADWAPEARVAVLADGAGGYRRGAEEARPHRVWGAVAVIRASAGFERLSDDDFDFEALTIAAARAHPRVRFARFDAAEDDVQLHFLALAGSRPRSLLPLLAANAREIRAAVPNFRFFVAAGARHTILGRPEFFALQVSGKRLRDWVADLAAHRDVRDVRCAACAAAFAPDPPDPPDPPNPPDPPDPPKEPGAAAADRPSGAPCSRLSPAVTAAPVKRRRVRWGERRDLTSHAPRRASLARTEVARTEVERTEARRPESRRSEAGHAEYQRGGIRRDLGPAADTPPPRPDLARGSRAAPRQGSPRARRYGSDPEPLVSSRRGG